MIFGRIKPLDAILATAEKKSLVRTLGPIQLTLLGVGAIIGTGIFVLTAAAAQKAGPGMMWSFVIAGLVCAFAALCYSELASMVPVSGSAYTYTYAVVGELLAWMVGWALILEYAVAASAVSVGWSGYFMGLLKSVTGLELPQALSAGPVWTMNGLIPHADFTHGFINIPAIVIALAVTALLVIGTTESARVNAVLVAIKVAALTAFVVLTLPVLDTGNFSPFAPNGWFGPEGTSGMGIVGAAASIFFAYVGFDAVSTAAEETKNPQRNVPIGLIGSLAICTVFYLFVAAGAIGAIGAQPVVGPDGGPVAPGSQGFAIACATAAHAGDLVCSNEALAHVLRAINWTVVGNALGLAANLALPSVILMMMFGQTRIFFVMARDGLLPDKLASIHPRFKTPHVVTMVTGVFVAIAAALLPVGQLADISNSGTLFAFFMVSIAVLVLRVKDADRHRPFRTPLVWVIAPLATVGCVFLFLNLPVDAQMVLPIWGGFGLVLYFLYGHRKSHVGRGIIDIHEEDADAPPLPVPPMPGAPTPGGRDA
ncbi:APA family basic amino acid/polyamine antiporter [Sphingobium wenxiniae]|uniref:Amino acid permease n=2 Tax=Sphingobium TaxID=165695 RepID=T0G8D4_9SPHN|nr:MULTISPECIES: amino acid permease [Sphingobium]EQB00011.1 amino acid permease [Sphingobium baderi LL03]KMS61798.1 amino acid permease [Sphingobium baderi LL03]MBB6190925.1 APA family basic amino acid/polyamine antiporter [Sphingobium wenxiniae]TWH93769.1 amino acid/polyamine/organocation transporter, APC superfamily (TC 2.A.3) [Sphingobium wenxiniae]WRD75665.1 amino acid permease [Sphingobium baderi]